MKRLMRFGILPVILLAIIAAMAAQPSNTQQHSTAQPYLTVQWTPSQTNTHHSMYDGYQPNQVHRTGTSIDWSGSAFLPNKTATGMAYCWGGFNDVSTFQNRIGQGKAAGANSWHDNYRSSHGRTTLARDEAAGIDCSGFVSRLWEIKTRNGQPLKLSTGQLRYAAFEIRPESFSVLPPRQGDVRNEAGSHVVWIDRHISHSGPNNKGEYVSEEEIYQASGWGAKPQNRVQRNDNFGNRTWEFNSKKKNSGYRLLRLDNEKPVVSLNGPTQATGNQATQTLEWIGNAALSDNASYIVDLKFCVFRGRKTDRQSVKVLERIARIAMEEIAGTWRPKPNQDFGAIKVNANGQVLVTWKGEGATTDGEYRVEVSAADLVGRQPGVHLHNPGQGWTTTVDQTFLVHRPGSLRGTVSSQDGGPLTNLKISLSLLTNLPAGWTFSAPPQTSTSFSFMNIPPGTYKVTYEADDHERAVRPHAGELIVVKPWQDLNIGGEALYPQKPGLTVRLRQYGVRKTLVGAVGVPVTISGPVSRTEISGRWGVAGRARFNDIPRGTYKVTANVYGLKRNSNGKLVRYTTTVSGTIAVSAQQQRDRHFALALPDPPGP